MPRRIPYFKPPFPAKAPDPAKAERDSFYSSARWMRLRAAFLSANPLCVECERIATIADHVEERLVRPDLALSWGNLRAMCSPCHTRRHKGRPA